jgi:hypothetical protein
MPEIIGGLFLFIIIAVIFFSLGYKFRVDSEVDSAKTGKYFEINGKIYKFLNIDPEGKNNTTNNIRVKCSDYNMVAKISKEYRSFIETNMELPEAIIKLEEMYKDIDIIDLLYDHGDIGNKYTSRK